MALGLSQSPSPPVRPPAGIVPQVRPRAEPSAASLDLVRYYTSVERDLLTRGLLRQDGGGPDTPYSATTLAENFETLVFYDEYRRRADTAEGGRLGRWVQPVRIGIEFGPSVGPELRARDTALVTRYAARLARITGHSISVTTGPANFHVLVASDDDRAFVENRMRQIVPGIGPAELDVFTKLPRTYYCFVNASTAANPPYTYARAVALVRAEHPDLMRDACYHEEIAQGLGIPNDSPRARPSIFNDDDEFAYLTSHDERLLKLLYDPRLSPGMTADDARPIVQVMAGELMGTQ